MPRLAYSVLTTRPVHFLLELQWGGRTFRLAHTTLVVPSDDGDLQFDAGLGDVSWDDGLELLSTEAPEGSLSVEVRFTDVSPAELIAAGHDLGSATAELSRWAEGTSWESREVLMRARVSEPQYGAAGEPVTFTLATEPYTDRTTTHRVGQRVFSGTWQSIEPLPDHSQGRTYPLVFGAPGWIPEEGVRIPGSPALTVSRWDPGPPEVFGRVLVAGHRTLADSIAIGFADEDDVMHWNVYSGIHETDLGGQPVTTVQLTSKIETRELWAAWTDGSGGLLNRTQTGAIRTAGELLDYLLDLTQLKVDQGRLAAAAAQLESYRLSGYIDQRCNVWQWVRDNLLPILPLSLHGGPDGLYPVVWRWGATAEEAVEHLSADRLEVFRAAPIRYTDIQDVANEITLSWAFDARTESYQRRAVLTGQTRGGGARLSTHRARVSYLRYGVRALDPIETWCVYDAGTAAAIVSWLGAYHALPARILEYEGGPELLHLELGDVVTITDSEVALSGEVAIVIGARDAGMGRIHITLRTIEDPSGA